MNEKPSKVEQFHALHQSGCFVIPNPWDAGSAVYLERLGFKALATTSAGFAFSKGLPDGPAFVSRDMMLEHFREISEATSLPVNADFQNGYADDSEAVEANVRLCCATGVAGLSIEDSTGKNEVPLYEFDVAVDRIRAARKAVDASMTGVLVVARCEAWLVGDPNPLRSSLDRLVAFADAGADCLYAPGVSKPEEIATIVKAVAPKPVNVLVSTNNCTLTVQQLADLGVRRISVGGALSRTAWAGFIRAAEEIKQTGTFTAFATATPFAELTKLFLNQS